MKCTEMFNTVDSLNQEYVKVWEDVCNIESPTKFKAGVDACGEYFAEMARTRGWKVEYFRQPVSGNIVDITLNPDAAEKPIIFSAHLDTVHPVGSFGSPAVKIEGDKMYGPGVTDCKGGAVAAFLAMDALDKNGFRSRPVKLILQTDEEVSSATSNKQTIGYMCDRALESVAFLNLEGSDKGKACLIRKGTITFTFKIEGVEAHGSQCATKGANAILDVRTRSSSLKSSRMMKDSPATAASSAAAPFRTPCPAIANSRRTFALRIPISSTGCASTSSRSPILFTSPAASAASTTPRAE